jgi:riboflavin kinase/FMN adenylyltransferase
MKIVTDINPAHKIRQKICLAAGFFDGVHLGHKKLLATLIRLTQRTKAKAWVLTFKEHPISALNRAVAPPLITSYEHKMLILEKMQVAGCISLDFSKKIANFTPEQFIKVLFKKMPALMAVVVGSNWTFGKNASGNPEILKMLGKKYNFKVIVLRPLKIKKQIVSSTLIRKLIFQGRLKQVEAMLGRPYSLHGQVVRGLGFGKKLGFPTANIEPFNEVFPPEGVYAAIVKLDSNFLKVVVSIGKRATLTQRIRKIFHLKQETKIEKKVPVIELHIIDKKFHDTILYDKKVEVFFIKKIRCQKKFSSVDLLKEAIHKDIVKAGKILNNVKIRS